MKKNRQALLLKAAPVLYRHFAASPDVPVDCPDDLFDPLLELSVALEAYNRRFPKRKVHALRVFMEHGTLRFLTDRTPFTVRKHIARAAAKIRARRSALRRELLERARAIPVTALFGSCILKDWKRLMPDEPQVVETILRFAARRALVAEDFAMLARWYLNYRKDEERSLFYRSLAEHKEPPAGAPELEN